MAQIILEHETIFTLQQCVHWLDPGSPHLSPPKMEPTGPCHHCFLWNGTSERSINIRYSGDKDTGTVCGS